MVAPSRWCSFLISVRMSTRSLRVEVGQRLVEQEDLRLAHQRAAHRDALALAAGELARLAVEQMIDLQHLRDLAHRRVALGLGHLAHLQPKAMFSPTVMFGYSA